MSSSNNGLPTIVASRAGPYLIFTQASFSDNNFTMGGIDYSNEFWTDESHTQSYGKFILLSNIPALTIFIRHKEGRCFPQYYDHNGTFITDTIIEPGVYVYQRGPLYNQDGGANQKYFITYTHISSFLDQYTTDGIYEFQDGYHITEHDQGPGPILINQQPV